MDILTSPFFLFLSFLYFPNFHLRRKRVAAASHLTISDLTVDPKIIFPIWPHASLGVSLGLTLAYVDVPWVNIARE